jgi:hypothetical protein
MKRRDWLAGALSVASITMASAARADGGSSTGATESAYLDFVALLLDETRRSLSWVTTHSDQTFCAKCAYQLADLRISLANKVPVPTSLKGAHLHLLSVLENAAAAFDAYALGDKSRASDRASASRLEDSLFVKALDDAHVSLPTVRA